MQNKHLEQSVLLASQIQKSFVRSKRENRGVRQAGFLVLRKTSMPSVLIELGFLSNRTEEKFLASKEGQTTLARSIYKAFCDYKYDHDRKMGSITGTVTTKPLSTPTEITTGDTSAITPDDRPTESSGNSNDGIVYKIQILTSDKKLSEKDKRFKGYDDISFYLEKGIYKYTYGSTSNYSEINSMLKKASKDFKGAFIIRIKDGQRLTNKKNNNGQEIF